MMDDFNITIRPRRLRYHPHIRDLVRENQIDINDLVAAVFVKHGTNIKQSIDSMPGFFHYSVDKLELIIDDDEWPLPKYRELLLIK